MFDDIADVSFLEGIELAELKKAALDRFSELSGETACDESKAILYSAAQIIYQTAAVMDFSARQNLLKYASGKYLDALALNHFITRKKAASAVVNIRFSLAAPRDTVTAIPAGTRITGGSGEIFFSTKEYAQIPAGKTEIDILAEADTGGISGNDFAIGELNVLADPIAYINAVKNTENPYGGSDIETDEELAERIYLSRYNYSTAGSESAYIYYCKEYSPLIDDIKVKNPKDAEIVIYILMKDRQSASDAFLSGLLEHLNNENIRPLTDKISVFNAEKVNYSIDISYKISAEDIKNAQSIQTAVNKAAAEYKEWQCGKIGRDIDPQKLSAMLYLAGARNMEIKQPAAKAVNDSEVACCMGININYTGIGSE